MRTATITFHASHNYGSMLQAYALQQTIKELGFDNDIINLRTARQKNIYSLPQYRKGGIIHKVLRNIIYAPFQSNITKKYNLFEDFLKCDLCLTEEFNSLESIEEANLDYDCFISGGDQIWNTSPMDFDWSFYLPFTKKKKISYGVSMGPKGQEQVKYRDKIKDYLSEYNHIYVREQVTKEIVESLVKTNVDIVLDPVLLFSKEKWQTCFNQNPIIEGDYILIYSPGYNKEVYSIGNKISNRCKMRGVITIHSPLIFKFPFLKEHIATGAWEFLNLLQNAKLVISGSYHALIFSILFEVPFFAVNGDKDNRMQTILKNTGLQDRTISRNDIHSKAINSFRCDFTKAKKFIDRERIRSIECLRNAITD